MPWCRECGRQRSISAFGKKRRVCKGCRRRARQMRLYGLTAVQVDALVAAGDRCAICGTAPASPKAIHVDHDHASGTVRGLLCANCNAVVGMVESGYVIDLAAILRYLDGVHLNLVPQMVREPVRKEDAPQQWLF